MKETLAYANILKNGSLQQREQLDILQEASMKNYQNRSMVNELALGVAEGIFSSVGNMPESTGKTVGEYLEVLVEPVYIPDIASDSIEESEKQRRRKARQQGQGIQL